MAAENMSLNRRPYSPRMSAEQWQCMLNYIIVNSAMGRVASNLRADLRQQMWQELTNELNEVAPASHSPHEWQRLWQERVAAVRAKAAEQVAEIRGTGGGPSNLSTLLGEDDAQVLSIVGVDSALDVGGPSFPRRQLRSPVGS
ncbi:hypothetical protein HPB49_013098 [Dermacentor silvarum]|uniref:Uncharacterized protein n=1 Tax=Dermacentor silvarum TaxID=543639 RepID=A0ACB8DP53_DERSI|nr:hypothetical protein HPB49_013098 [Dermacentor silvarum]